MKKFLLRMALFLTPVFVAMIACVVYDPMMVFRRYDNYYAGRQYPVWMNHSMASIRTLDNSNVRFDSFLIGDSRSVNFRVKDWEKYLPEGSRAFHLDAYNADLETIVRMLEYAESSGHRPANVLLPLNAMNFGRTKAAGYRFADPPAMGGSFLNFYIEHVRAFIDPRFFDPYIEARLKGDSAAIKTQPWYYDYTLTTYNPAVNEIYETADERKIATGTLYTPHQVDSLKQVRITINHVSRPKMTTDDKKWLTRLADLFRRNHTDGRIVVMPFRDGVILSETDYRSLTEIFGRDNVVRADTLTLDLIDFYDNNHPSHTGTMAILQHIYNPETN